MPIAFASYLFAFLCLSVGIDEEKQCPTCYHIFHSHAHFNYYYTSAIWLRESLTDDWLLACLPFMPLCYRIKVLPCVQHSNTVFSSSKLFIRVQCVCECVCSLRSKAERHMEECEGENARHEVKELIRTLK